MTPVRDRDAAARSEASICFITPHTRPSLPAAAAGQAYSRCTKSGATPMSSTRRRADSCRPPRRFCSTLVHLYANGTDSKAHLEVGFKFHPRGYKPTLNFRQLFVGNGPDLDIKGNEANQRVDAYFTLPQHMKISTYEPHMHAGRSHVPRGDLGRDGADAQLLQIRSQLGQGTGMKTMRRRCCRKGRSCTSSDTSIRRPRTGTFRTRETGPGRVIAAWTT